MAEITAKMVADLRASTGLGMMECKKALVEAEGNMEKAEEILRIKSGAKAGKLAGRTAAEGVLACAIEGKTGALVEVNCETDFVAKDAGFVAFAQSVAKTAATQKPATVEELETGFRFNDAILRHLTIQMKAAVTEASPMMREEKSKSLIAGETANEDSAEA